MHSGYFITNHKRYSEIACCTENKLKWIKDQFQVAFHCCEVPGAILHFETINKTLSKQLTVVQEKLLNLRGYITISSLILPTMLRYVLHGFSILN